MLSTSWMDAQFTRLFFSTALIFPLITDYVPRLNMGHMFTELYVSHAKQALDKLCNSITEWGLGRLQQPPSTSWVFDDTYVEMSHEKRKFMKIPETQTIWGHSKKVVLDPF